MFFFQAASLAAVTSSAGGRVHCREKLPLICGRSRTGSVVKAHIRQLVCWPLPAFFSQEHLWSSTSCSGILGGVPLRHGSSTFLHPHSHATLPATALSQPTPLPR